MGKIWNLCHKIAKIHMIPNKLNQHQPVGNYARYGSL